MNMSELLAIHGESPVRKKLLPYGQQWIDEYDIKSVVDVLRGDWITQGPKINEFEKKIADYCNAKYAVAYSSGTAALHAACFAAGVTKDDEVITTPITFAASSNAVLYCNGTPIFADIQQDTINIDPVEIKKKISQKTKVILPVDFAGHPCDLDEIQEIAEEKDLIVVEDAAHAVGSEYKGKKIGGISDLTALSFHPVKTITTGEGGMVLTNNEIYAKKLQIFRTHGITKKPEEMIRNEGNWYYEMHELGYNYRITDLQCALGISQFTKLDSFIRKRREIVKAYNEAFTNIENINIPYEKPDVTSAYHLYVIQLKNINRKKVFDALRAENIGVNVHYIPVYYHPYYQKNFRIPKGSCKNAELYYERALTLPLFPKMTEKDIEDVIIAVRKVIKYYGRNPN
jgi:perosamine synthetase